jgi:hypothetical protein
MTVFVARREVVCMMRTTRTFHDRVCGATKSGVYEANYIPRACLWRDEKWRVLSEPHSSSVFVERRKMVCMERTTFDERVCGATRSGVYEASLIPRA